MNELNHIPRIKWSKKVGLEILPGLSRWVSRTEMTAFWEQAVFADWRNSGLIPESASCVEYIKEKSETGTLFVNIERLDKSWRGKSVLALETSK